MHVNKQNLPTSAPKAGLFHKLATLFGAPNRTRLSAHVDTTEHEEIEPLIYVTAVGKPTNCFVIIIRDGQEEEAIDATFGSTVSRPLAVGDEVMIVDYRSSWPVVRKVAKVIDLQKQRLPSNYRMSASM